MKTRRVFLYQITELGNRLITSKAYRFTTLAAERQIADDLGHRFQYRQGDGYMVIADSEGFILDKLDLKP